MMDTSQRSRAEPVRQRSVPAAMAGAALVALLASVGEVAAKGSKITFDTPAAQAPATLTVKSAAFSPGRPIPRRHSAYDDNISPPLAWSGAPATASSFVVIIEDPDAEPAEPVVHWVAWNIPKETTQLKEGVQVTEPAAPHGVLQGANSHGGTGYYGPHPPKGDPPHRYFVQVFALDKALALPQGSALEAVRHAMAGHILAKGKVFGTFVRPSNPKHP